MQVQSASAYSAWPLLNVAASQRQQSTIAASAKSTLGAATITDRATISQAARDRLAAHANSAVPSPSGTTAVFETDQGSLTLNIDDYFTPAKQTSGTAFSLPPLLLPNQQNIDALRGHISSAFPQFLAQNHIPFPPSSITYDSEGKIQLPGDYPYAAQFKQALANNPTMARELSTVNALTSDLVEMRKSIPFQQEYAAAGTQAEADAVLAKYRYLFADNRHYATIALQFSADGSLSLTADGEPVS